MAKKVIKVILPDGASFISDKTTMPEAQKAAVRYLHQHGMNVLTEPLTRFQCIEMTEEEYNKTPGTNSAHSFWNGV